MATRVVNIRNHRNWKEEGGVYIGREWRGTSSIFGNPYRIGDKHPDHTDKKIKRKDALELYYLWFYDKLERNPDFASAVEDLRGKMLVCWCRPKDGFKGRLMCHGQIIKEYLDNGNY